MGGESLARTAGYVEGYASRVNTLAERRQLGISVDLFLPLFILYTSLSMMEEGVEVIDRHSGVYAQNPPNKH